MAAVERVVEQLIQYGKIVRPALNVQVPPPGLFSTLQQSWSPNLWCAGRLT